MGRGIPVNDRLVVRKGDAQEIVKRIIFVRQHHAGGALHGVQPATVIIAQVVQNLSVPFYQGPVTAGGIVNQLGDDGEGIGDKTEPAI